MHFSVATLAAFVAAVSALPAYNHIVHEKRDNIPAQWIKRSKMDANVHLPVRVGLKQRNLHRANEYLDEVSNPASARYGQHWSIEEINAAFAPSQESTDAVLQWLADHGVVSAGKTQALHTLEFEMTVADMERLLKTEYFVYEHEESGVPHIACEEYSVPAHIRDHIDIITPTLHFDIKPKSSASKTKRSTIPNPAKPEAGSHPYFEESAAKHSKANDETIQSCVDAITPDCLRALYNIPEPTSKPCADNSFGIVEYAPNSYISADLDAFFANYTPSAVGSRPEFVSVNNGTLDTSDPTDFDDNGESNLDLEYATALVYPQNITLYEIGPENSNTPDASFIKTKVLSTSWGSNENDLTPAYERTLCNEYMKLGLAGVSILFSTADHGVAGNTDDCTGNRFQPDFPATCPYVTAVGATMVDPNTKDLAAVLAKGGQPEVAINHTVKSGGGFSDVFAIPSYQQDVVAHYLKAHTPPYSAAQYNNSGNARAVPDLSLNGANYQVVVDGTLNSVDGTSASTPVFGAMITLINEQRLSQGKSSLGFLNPAIYQHFGEFGKDVTQGSNPGCGTDGFEATEGWDPVTGLGTVDFAKMMAVLGGL